MDTVWQVSADLWRVVLTALVFGAGLPAIFALGVRLQSHATVGGPGVQHSGTRRRATTAGAMVCFAVVLAVIITGILFVAKAFLAARLGIHLFGQS